MKDVDIEKGYYIIHSTFSKNVLKDKRKGKMSKPVINPIHEELKSITIRCLRDKTPDNFEFINPRTKMPYTEDTLLRIWHSVKKKLNLDEKLRLYDATRHSFASNLLNHGVSIAKISKLLGHTNIKTTERYAHVDINSLKVDINKISILQFKKENNKDNKDKEATEID
ncbi:MAG: site-specific integrase [Desulfobacterota bacterium]|nr:site-specific integrase [Thermodesulfobacteriota bacterium]